MTRFRALLTVAIAMLFAGCQDTARRAALGGGGGDGNPGGLTSMTTENDTDAGPSPKASSGEAATAIATLGGGCFWCVEAVLEQYEGVLNVVSGYMGGRVENPTYEQICTGATGHAEVIKVTFDAARISYDEILDIFWRAHDPTTLNRQGNDVGTQYRSVIFYHDEPQRLAAEASKKKVEALGLYSAPIVTEIAAASTFYEAEKYHQDYYRRNKQQPYCQFVISPKLDKLGLKK